jgi:P27 family predicted phage terminase small subunit
MRQPNYLDKHAKVQWQKYAPSLRVRADITDQDWHNLECFCSNYSAYRQAQEDLKANGLILTFSNDNRGQNPAFKAMLEAQKLMIKFGELLGFDPISRIKLPQNLSDEDELDALLS